MYFVVFRDFDLLFLIFTYSYSSTVSTTLVYCFKNFVVTIFSTLFLNSCLDFFFIYLFWVFGFSESLLYPLKPFLYLPYFFLVYVENVENLSYHEDFLLSKTLLFSPHYWTFIQIYFHCLFCYVIFRNINCVFINYTLDLFILKFLFRFPSINFLS